MSARPSTIDPVNASPFEETIQPAEQADRLARREPLTILDVRADVDWAIEAPSATQRHLPAAHVLATPGLRVPHSRRAVFPRWPQLKSMV